MSVTASFEPDRITTAPGATAALSLHLQNNSDSERMVKLLPAGSLAELTVLQTDTIYLDPREHFEVPVIVDANSSLTAGTHDCVIDVLNDQQTFTARATVHVNASTGWTAALQPTTSKSGKEGRHKVAVTNTGTAAVEAHLTPFSASGVTTEVATQSVRVEAGQTANVELRIVPVSQFWRGPTVEHPFTVKVTGDDSTETTLAGVYEQRARVPQRSGAALASILGALVLGTIAWFALLKPAIENIAEREARLLDTAQQTAIDERVAEMQAAAEEASELPLGRPADVRLAATATAQTSNSAGQVVDKGGSGRVFSITDVIFQNPTGAVGRVQLVRQTGAEPSEEDDILLDQELANFRDLDFHLVAPLTFESDQTISLRLTCDTPGPGTDRCEVSATVLGFIDG